MTTEKKIKQAIKIIEWLVDSYPYIAEDCQNNKGKPCKHCTRILKAKKFLIEVEQ